MLDPLKISAVQYLNTKPFIAGLEVYASSCGWVIEKDTPAECAQKLHDGQVDIGLLPIASLPMLPTHKPITNWGIAADGAVQSVLLLSNVEITEVKEIWLDYQSKTSNELLRILMRDHFGQEVDFLDSKKGYEGQIDGTRAGLVIGDRALKTRSRFGFSYDLAQLWKDMTGLPFVFARWVGSARIDLATLENLEKAFALGMDHRGHIAKKEQDNYPETDVAKYLTEHIHYQLEPSYHQGLELFQAKQVQLTF